MWGSFAHQRCFHCGAVPCVTVCPTGALAKWNGLTVIAPEKCTGCGYCTDARPFKVPHIIANSVSKCTACLGLRGRVVPVYDVPTALRLQDGQEPWCVPTCPSQAIKFGERDSLLAETRVRAADLRPRYPNAHEGGEAQLDGPGLLMILLDGPGTYGLPTTPVMPATATVWQEAVQPAATGLSALAAYFAFLYDALSTMGTGFVTEQYARMEHPQWLETLSPEAFAAAPGTSKDAKANESDIKSAAE